MWPGFDSWTWLHMWVEFVVGSHPRSEGFSPGSPVFPPPQKSTLLKFQFDRERAKSGCGIGERFSVSSLVYLVYGCKISLAWSGIG